MICKALIVVVVACLLGGGFVLGQVLHEDTKPVEANVKHFKAQAIEHALGEWGDDTISPSEVVAISEGDGFTIRHDGKELILVHKGGDLGRDNWEATYP